MHDYAKYPYKTTIIHGFQGLTGGKARRGGSGRSLSAGGKVRQSCLATGTFGLETITEFIQFELWSCFRFIKKQNEIHEMTSSESIYLPPSRKFEKLDGRNTSYRFDLERDIRWKDMPYTFLEDGEIETASLTYGQLDLRARAIAVRLREIWSPWPVTGWTT
uniref:Uncharacterized protein n=1 Tax=Candidatus Kentrum sp. LFY TaxID=2126342 RepID=A0A450WQ99_9GAMM|nr:MAG: hypothetical protein BECKLFY1418C_GA0070996_105512 [Candidatus Kentron sp. LFY]